MEASVSSLSDPHPNKTIFGMSILAQSKPTVRMTVSARAWSADYPNWMAWWRLGVAGYSVSNDRRQWPRDLSVGRGQARSVVAADFAL